MCFKNLLLDDPIVNAHDSLLNAHDSLLNAHLPDSFGLQHNRQGVSEKLIGNAS
jgi:hypothetical protein